LTPPLVEYTAAVLRRLGFRVGTRYVTHASLAHPPARVFRGIQLIPAGWTDPTPHNFFATWFTCSGAADHGWFCIPRLDRQIQHVKSLATTAPHAAAAHWTAIDHEIVDRAGWVPLVNPRWVELVSARVGNYQHHPYWGLLAAQVWLR
jgi:hypothetical protein